MARLLVPLFVVAACASPPPVAVPPMPAAVGEPPRSPSPPVARAAPAKRCAGDAFALAPGAATARERFVESRRGTMVTTAHTLVATSHARATEAGLAVLRAGGSAADAFVAAVLVDDVVFPGVTSAAGLAGILVYEAKTKSTTYIHGGLADPVNPDRRHRAGETASGKQVLVPGAPAAYVELAKRFGKKPLGELVEPAAKLADDGFVVSKLYAGILAHRRAILERSAYGRRTFFKDARPVAEGETLRLVELAKTLRAFGRDPGWFYKGPWVREAVLEANAAGGALKPGDFGAYRIEVGPAFETTFRGYTVHAGGQGGFRLLASLRALETLRGGRPAEPPSKSARSLEDLLRVQRAAITLPMLFDRAKMAQPSSIDLAAAGDLVARKAAEDSAAVPPPEGPHSSAAIVVDGEGNVVVGTHSIETQPWGEGLFAGGVPLSTSAAVYDAQHDAKRPLRLDPVTTAIALADGAPRVGLTVYGSGLQPADVQILDGVLARGLSAEDAIFEPRVGYYDADPATGRIDGRTSVVDPRFDADLLCTLKERGLHLRRSMSGGNPAFVDTGFPTLVTIAPGSIQGMTPDVPHVDGAVAGD